jgi:hypothetical protein
VAQDPKLAPYCAAPWPRARHASHLRSTIAALSLALTAEDRAGLDAVLADSVGPLGDVYALEREKGGQHAAIMRYNLNRL